MKRHFILITMIALSLALSAEIHSEAGKYGFKFLNIPLNPVSSALAGRGVHSEANIGSWILQPSAAAMYSHQAVAISHSSWLGDTAYTSVVYSNASRNSHIGLAMRNLSYGEIDKRDETGLYLGTYSPTDIGVSGNYARRLSPSIYVGANLNVAYQKLDTASALALTADLGITTLTLLNDSRVSFSARNLGFSNKMDEENVKLPHSFDLDVYKGFQFNEQHLGLESGVVFPPDADPQAHIASELTLLERLHLRAGYKFNTDVSGITAGLGFAISGFNLDYGFTPHDDGLGDAHSFGLSYSF